MREQEINWIAYHAKSNSYYACQPFGIWGSKFNSRYIEFPLANIMKCGKTRSCAFLYRYETQYTRIINAFELKGA
jgi:hypothetical protein